MILLKPWWRVAKFKSIPRRNEITIATVGTETRITTATATIVTVTTTIITIAFNVTIDEAIVTVGVVEDFRVPLLPITTMRTNPRRAMPKLLRNDPVCNWHRVPNPWPKRKKGVVVAAVIFLEEARLVMPKDGGAIKNPTRLKRPLRPPMKRGRRSKANPITRIIKRDPANIIITMPKNLTMPANRLHKEDVVDAAVVEDVVVGVVMPKRRKPLRRPRRQRRLHPPPRHPKRRNPRHPPIILPPWDLIPIRIKEMRLLGLERFW
mmetsp:Transcript_33452/g.69648  ORF Transcript_33452/g.69648 Transcript_33452/m.69648 type:complete len:264 (+) Transcript_33452:584-1375(+)